MRKIWPILVAFCGFAFVTGAHAHIDAGLYPFMDVCGDEIGNYCVDVGDGLGDCMIANYGLLGDDCGDAVFFWAGEHYGWRDPDIRDRWDGMSARERHEYVVSHKGYLDDFQSRSGVRSDMVPHHEPDHESPADAAEFREFDNFDSSRHEEMHQGMHPGGEMPRPEMGGGGHMGGMGGMGGGMHR